jgi:hypothetical protein
MGLDTKSLSADRNIYHKTLALPALSEVSIVMHKDVENL